MRKGALDLPLHYGKAPRWLFVKMVGLARAISELIIVDTGPQGFLEKISDPWWFQCFGCVLGFDWHSSGLTTTVCGALKEALKDLSGYGLYVCGGKGKTARKTPQEITAIADKLGKDLSDLVYASRMAAKVDNTVLQDGFSLYHHTFIFTSAKQWAVIQQGLKDGGGQRGWSRRYHWFSPDTKSFVCDPHKAVVSEKKFLTLNMAAKESAGAQEATVGLAQRKPADNLSDLLALKKEIKKLPLRHRVLLSDINPKYLEKVFLKTYIKKPVGFEELVDTAGLGPKSLRALALIADLLYAGEVSFRDPARFSFAHGGKDGHPYRVNLAEYQATIETLGRILNKARIPAYDKTRALRRLYNFYH